MRYSRRLVVILVAALVLVAGNTRLLACPICFRMEQGPVADGVRAAVLVLMAVTVGVLGCFARFVVRLATAEPIEPSEPLEPREPA